MNATITSVARKQDLIRLNLSEGSITLPDDERWMGFAKINLPGFPRVVKYKPSPGNLQQLVGAQINIETEGNRDYAA